MRSGIERVSFYGTAGTPKQDAPLLPDRLGGRWRNKPQALKRVRNPHAFGCLQRKLSSLCFRNIALYHARLSISDALEELPFQPLREEAFVGYQVPWKLRPRQAPSEGVFVRLARIGNARVSRVLTLRKELLFPAE